MDDPIVIENLTKNFNGLRAVDSLNLKVKRKSFVGFLGPNGSGKTTTIKILTNLLSPTDGRAYLEGVDVTKDPKRALAQIGAVVETPEFYPYLTPGETLGYLGELRGISDSDLKQRTKEVLETVHMTEWVDKRIGKFSKGMKQRIAVAQAILHEPSILILDEPTSGLDPRGMFEVREILMELKKQDYTVFMSSHLLNEVQEVCGEVALINKGQLIRNGPVSELTGADKLRRLEIKTIQPISEEWLGRISKLHDVSELEIMGPNIFVLSLAGGDDAQANLLRELYGLNLDVVSFKESGMALENLYMSLIKESR
ncbi:MAG: ABC transporter ATP-binding protein [Methanomassiliicoccales archaeon]|jgi:ABC-2 type transport system ATP-binding protein